MCLQFYILCPLDCETSFHSFSFLFLMRKVNLFVWAPHLLWNMQDGLIRCRNAPIVSSALTCMSRHKNHKWTCRRRANVSVCMYCCRYTAVAMPLLYNTRYSSRRRVAVMISVVWFLSFAISCPLLFGLNNTGNSAIWYFLTFSVNCFFFYTNSLSKLS